MTLFPLKYLSIFILYKLCCTAFLLWMFQKFWQNFYHRQSFQDNLLDVVGRLQSTSLLHVPCGPFICYVIMYNKCITCITFMTSTRYVPRSRYHWLVKWCNKNLVDVTISFHFNRYNFYTIIESKYLVICP